MYVYVVCLFHVCCSDCVGVCGNVCCVAAVVKDSLFSLGVLKYIVCLYKGCKGCGGCCVFVCIVTRRAVGAHVWEVSVFHHADVVCLCLVCILW